MKLRSRHHGGVVFEGLSKADRARLDGFLAQVDPVPGMEGLIPTDPPGTPDPKPETKRKRGRRA